MSATDNRNIRQQKLLEICEIVLTILATADVVLYVTDIWEPAGDLLSVLILLRILVTWPERNRRNEQWELVQEGKLKPEEIPKPKDRTGMIIVYWCCVPIMLMACIYDLFLK